MRIKQASNQRKRPGRCLLPVIQIVVALILVFSASALAKEALSLEGVRVVDAAQFSYQVTKVSFKEPRRFSTGAGVCLRTEVVKVVVRGYGFRPKATGPIVWLNRIPTLRTDVAEDGTSVEAYFLESIQELEQAAARLGGWEVLYQPHAGAQEVYRISPASKKGQAE